MEDRERVYKYVLDAKLLDRIVLSISYHLESRFSYLYEIIEKIRSHKFVLNGLWDAKEGVQGKPSGSADKIVTVINHHFNPENPGSMDICRAFIRHQLSGKTMATTGSKFFGLGARDDTTVQLYQEILAILDRNQEPPANARRNVLS